MYRANVRDSGSGLEGYLLITVVFRMAHLADHLNIPGPLDHHKAPGLVDHQEAVEVLMLLFVE